MFTFQTALKGKIFAFKRHQALSGRDVRDFDSV